MQQQHYHDKPNFPFYLYCLRCSKQGRHADDNLSHFGTKLQNKAAFFTRTLNSYIPLAA